WTSRPSRAPVDPTDHARGPARPARPGGHRARARCPPGRAGRAGPRERVRLLTLPITREGRLVQLVQVGISLERAQRTLDRYLETLLVLIPLGLMLAAAGGAVIARTALRPVDAMSRTARRI